mmetsp:Transcript_12858/g.19918  ORF Transcript_12858/g.19918 Transcript_12858/m.19918 type:complete len:123 (-) Transcript_12858:1391-1759(-)
MFVPATYENTRFEIFKLIKIQDEEKEKLETEAEALRQSLVQENKISLSVLGMGPANDVLFQYQNPAQSVNATFGFNLKYYTGFKKTDIDTEDRNLTVEEEILSADSEGVYTFKAYANDQLPR